MPVPKQWVISEPWVIRDRTNGHYIKGGTAMEAEPLRNGCWPRLFHSELSCKRFLDQWQRGVMWQDGDGYINVRAIPGRDKRVFDIFQLQLVRVP